MRTEPRQVNNESNRQHFIFLFFILTKGCAPFFSAFGFVVVGAILGDLSVSIELSIGIWFKGT